MDELFQNEIQLRIKVGRVGRECLGAEIEVGGRRSVIHLLLETVGRVNYHSSYGKAINKNYQYCSIIMYAVSFPGSPTSKAGNRDWERG